MRTLNTPQRMRHRIRVVAGLVLALVLPLLVACGQQATRPPLKVVATIAPLGDWARQVGRERVDVTQIVPAGVDPKTYQLTAADRQTISQADVVLCNGLGLEPWLADVLRSRDPQTFVALQLSDFVGPLAEGERVTVQSPLAGEAADGQPPGTAQSRSTYVPKTVYSPYIWLSPGITKAQRAVLYVGDTFTRADPQGIRFYRGNAERYIGELENLHIWVGQQFEQWPLTRVGTSNRKVIQLVDHSWWYFATEYGFTLRTLSNGQSTAAANEQTTPLFVNRYTSAAQQARLPHSPDGVLDPFVSDIYVDMIKSNVGIMLQGVQQAAIRTDTFSSVPREQYEVP